MIKEELQKLFTNELKFEELKKKLLFLKEKDDLIKYLDLIVPIFGNGIAFSKYTSNPVEKIYQSLLATEYDFELIHKETIRLLDEKFHILQDIWKEKDIELTSLEQKTQTFFSNKCGERTIKIVHGGGLRCIIDFLSNNNDGYRLEGDSRTGLQVHHSDAESFMFRSYNVYPSKACERSLDTPAVLEAEIDGHWLLHANNDYEAAILPISVLHLKNIQIIPLCTMTEKQVEQCNKRLKGKLDYFDDIFMLSNLTKHTFDEKKFSGNLCFKDYKSFIEWYNLSETNKLGAPDNDAVEKRSNKFRCCIM